MAVAPYESAVNYSLCQCLARLGKHQEAEELQAKFKRIEDDLAQMADQARAIALKPHDPALRCRAGIILLHNGMESEGLRWLESALAEDPLHAATHQAIAEYYERAGNSERAEQHRQLARTAGAPLAGASGKASPDSRR